MKQNEILNKPVSTPKSDESTEQALKFWTDLGYSEDEAKRFWRELSEKWPIKFIG